MAPIGSLAVILHAFPYGETSKIVRLLTRDLGPQSAMARGARQARSRFGARLQVFSEGVVQLYLKPNRDLQTMADFDVTEQHEGLTRDVRRYAAAAALAEIVLRFSPAEPVPDIFDLTVQALASLDKEATSRLAVASLGWLWVLVAALGFAPRADACARDGRALPVGPVRFSVAEGGFLCDACAHVAGGTTLELDDRGVLERLISGNASDIEPIAPRHAAAHRRLLVRFVERHVAEGRELKALELWRELA
jgi:DNA repair protein RecO (recombination protein O)